MKEIKLVYNPIPRLGISRTVTGMHPESWSEVTPAQLIAIARSYQSNISEHKFLSVMTGIHSGIIRKLDEFQRFILYGLIDFTEDNKPFHSFILTTINLEGETFYSPMPQLKK